MRILITNDDGINSEGLWTLVDALDQVGDVSVVAPDRDQSGIGTARTLLNILRVSEVEARKDNVPAYTVSGTPSDCVILAAETIFSDPFDLVVSGINEGANLGLDVFDSGTVGGAMRGYFRGIPSIAVSVTSVTGVLYSPAAQVAKSLATAVGRIEPRPVLYNVNVPNVAPDRLKGVRTTFLGPKAYLENVEKGHDGRRTHFWIRHNKPIGDDIPNGCDVWATRNGWVSITPMDPANISTSDLAGFAGLSRGVAESMDLDWA